MVQHNEENAREAQIEVVTGNQGLKRDHLLVSPMLNSTPKSTNQTRVTTRKVFHMSQTCGFLPLMSYFHFPVLDKRIYHMSYICVLLDHYELN